ncbi:MAG: AsmA-like C-terminal domain-containing protein, partial [Ghiorsea sp.]
HAASPQTWKWQASLMAEDGGQLVFDDAHVRIPFAAIKANGTIGLSTSLPQQLTYLDIAALKWRNDKNFADAMLHWRDDHLHIQITDGSATMPMLWSWLWMLGEDGFQQWLGLMKHGRLDGVQATLDLPWERPLSAAPTAKDIENMTYHVLTHVSDADIALGVAGDFLWRTDADVEIDQDHLTAHMNSTDLDKKSGRISGDFAIAWDTLMMNITGKGKVDVGKLHAWLDHDAAAALHWGKAPATATLKMDWDVDADGPEKALVYLKPKGSWALRPYDIPLITRQGVAIWDANKGLTIKKMHAHSPWLDGEVSMFLDSRADWSLKSLQLEGSAPLERLTNQFSLPIENPAGLIATHVTFKDSQWQGNLDFKQSTWTNFLGVEKGGDEDFAFAFQGESPKQALFPIQLTHLQSSDPDFQLGGQVKIHRENLEFSFANMKTPAFTGDFRLNIPLDESIAWGMEVTADAADQSAFAMYFKSDDEGNVEGADAKINRPWSIYADVKQLTWKSSLAEGVHVQFSSDDTSTGTFKAAHLLSGDVDLEQLSTSFTMLEHGKFDLHLLDAKGSGQHLRVSGSVQPLPSGALKWQGLAVMDGQFGTLMQQAELDKLFKEGEMSAVFIGNGEFMEGEPWYRGMQGRFRLLVEDGRMMQGGTLTRLLAAISLVDLPKYLIFQRKDVVGEGLLYEKMQIEAVFAEEKLHIDGLAFRSSALDAGGQGVVNLASGDLELLLIARPWQNIESVLGNIPILGYILAGSDKSLLRKVYHIHGPASDALVDEMRPEDAGLPQSGLLESLFSLPSQWFGD